MELYIVRHGEAVAVEDTEGGTDAERALTEEGRKKTADVGRRLRALDCRPGRIGSSPLVRARQTAEVLAQALGPDVPVESCAFLAPGAGPAAVVEWLRRLRDAQVMIVGHMPDLADIASGLLARGARLDILFKKSAVCCIAFEGRPAEGEGRLEWLMQPREMRAR